MTIQETIQMAIEFERRLIEIDPSFEVENKVDRETIYKFLNQYAQQYYDQLMQVEASTKSGDPNNAKVQSFLHSFVCNKEITAYRHPFVTEAEQEIEDAGQCKNCYMLDIPNNFYKYIRSNSVIMDDKLHKKIILPNKLASQEEVNNILYNSLNLGRILRNPIVLIKNYDKDTATKQFQVIYDEYTKNIYYVQLIYYKKLTQFGAFDDGNTACDFPYSCFWDIVNGAVDLYIYTYKYGVTLESLKRKAKQQIQDQREAAKHQQED